MTEETTPADYRKQNWSGYRPGQKVGGVRIIRPMGKEDLMRNTYYRIRYLCCGESGIISHAQIRKRISKESENCMACGRIKARQKLLSKEINAPCEPLGFDLPAWAVPPSVKQMPLGWVPFGGSSICYGPGAWARIVPFARSRFPHMPHAFSLGHPVDLI